MSDKRQPYIDYNEYKYGKTGGIMKDKIVDMFLFIFIFIWMILVAVSLINHRQDIDNLQQQIDEMRPKAPTMRSK